MKIAIIGGGFTGLTAAYELAKAGHKVTLFEKDKVLGGLAHGFRRPGWSWHLEYAYHHLFANDYAILSLVKELGLSDKLILKRPITANYISAKTARGGVPFRSTVTALAKKSVWRDGGLDLDGVRTRHADLSAAGPAVIVPFDSPFHLLKFPYLSFLDKLRTASLLAFCKLNPFWQPLEGMTAETLFKVVGGKRAWEVIWEPLMVGKFGNYNRTIAASWLWARIKKRTPRLMYMEGGFQTVVEALEKSIKRQGGNIRTGVSVPAIQHKNFQLSIFNFQFDKVLLTVPTPIAFRLLPELNTKHYALSAKIPHLHAQSLILETRQPIIRDIYWLNITDKSFPFLAVVAHTNFMDKKHYGNHHLTYFGNYLPPGHPYLALSAKQLLSVFRPFIARLNPQFNFKFQILNFKLFLGWYAQPVHQLHYSQRAPKLETSIPGVYLANLDSIYPWDRGTNYAVELGQKAANLIKQNEKEYEKSPHAIY